MKNPFAGPRRNYAFLLPLFAVALLYQLTYTGEVIRINLHGPQIADIPFTLGDDVIAVVSPEAEKAGLHAGDRIVHINRRLILGERDFHEAFLGKKAGDVIRFEVIPEGQTATRTISVSDPPRNPHALNAGEWTVDALLTGAMLFCTLIGIYAVALRPYDARALFFFALMLAISQMIQSASTFDFPHNLWLFAFSYRLVTSIGLGFWLVSFALYFPERFGWDLRKPWIKWTFLGPMALWLVFMTVFAGSGYWNFHLLPSLDRFGNVVVPIVNTALLFAGSIGFFCAALGAKLGTTANRDSKRRLQILIAGTIVSLTPAGCFVVYMQLTKNYSIAQHQVFVAVIAGGVCLFPITLAYVVLTERAMHLRMVIRQGLRYTLAKGGLRVIFGIATGLLIAGLNVFLFGRVTTIGLPERITISIALITLMLVILGRTHRRLRLWLDRKFFREAYNAEKVLEDLSDTVHSIRDEKEMLETVARRISESLHVGKCAILLNGDNEFEPVYCLGFETSSVPRLSEQSTVVDVIKQSKEPSPIYFDRTDNWVHGAPETELVTLKSLHSQLLLPMGAKEEVRGILSLGPKLSEEPYTRSDVQLLRSVALQAGLALENNRLTRSIALEIAQREKLNREIEIAREVQERLFPQRLPAIAGIDYHGACRPALGVGGDYYDFLELPNGDLGIAIGDVSGKGIAAALLMASLQASLRGQALVGQGDLARLMANVNQLVYDATPSNRYATFFYGQYHHEQRILRYVNAGHNPPIVLRRAAEGTIHVVRLDTGGPVIGLFPGMPYQEGSLIMEAGDVFVGFTDGISEAMNRDEEEWGEERMIPALAECADRKAAEMIPAVIARADQFASGAPQHDDMTLVVVKMAAA